jgi:predicted O-linked N-acetylglucosamine transferase (SPINDLY family)
MTGKRQQEVPQALALFRAASARQAEGRWWSAARLYQAHLRLAPRSIPGLSGLANVRLRQGRIEDAVALYAKAVSLAPHDPALHSAWLSILAYRPGYTHAEIFAESLRWAKRHAADCKPLPFDSARRPGRIRVGYVSPDFWTHTAGRLIEPILAAHDRSRFEIFCYSLRREEDAQTARLKALADHWVNLSDIADDEAAARRITEDGIDILMDLTGHMIRNRLRIFAFRPAPVQVAWLGFPTSTGLSTVDYRLTDRFRNPPGEGENCHTEKLVRLPAYCPFIPYPGSPEVNDPPAAARDVFTYASFNALKKVNREVIALWADILREVPRARLKLLLGSPATLEDGREAILKAFAAHGIAPERIELLTLAPMRQYLASHQDCDLVLDAFPFNGYMTSFYALWMGVPVLSLKWPTPPGSMGASLLSELGLTELVAATPEQYRRLAIELAQDPGHLAALRQDLRTRLAKSRLCDLPQFVRTLEAAYAEMQRRVLAGEPPAGFTISDSLECV